MNFDLNCHRNLLCNTNNRLVSFRLNSRTCSRRNSVHSESRSLSLVCKAESAVFPSPGNRSNRGGGNADYGQSWQQSQSESNEQKSKRAAVSSQAHRQRQGPVRKEKPPQGESISSSLFVDFGSLPPDGKSVTTAEETCDPYEQRCKTPVHVWEMNCKKCYGTGVLTSSSRRGGRHSYTCLACHGLGCVRQASTQKIPDLNNGAWTIARDTPGEGSGPKR